MQTCRLHKHVPRAKAITARPICALSLFLHTLTPWFSLVWTALISAYSFAAWLARGVHGGR